MATQTTPDIVNGVVEHEPQSSSALPSIVKPAALPTVEQMRQKMTHASEMRALLIEYVKTNMDSATHFYTIPGAQSDKPGLSQDGARNLRALYEVRAGDPEFSETFHDDGHYTCRVTVRVYSMANGEQVASGTGMCSTRESKYAYRWAWPNDVPAHLDKANLPSRQRGRTQQYKVPNSDLADSYHTVSVMAEKRAETRATLELPYASEVFSSSEPEEDVEREGMLAEMRDLFKSVPKAQLDTIAQECFRREMKEIGSLSTEALGIGLGYLRRTVEHMQQSGGQATDEELKAARKESGQQAATELFDKAPVITTPEDDAEERPSPPSIDDLCRDVLGHCKAINDIMIQRRKKLKPEEGLIPEHEAVWAKIDEWEEIAKGCDDHAVLADLLAQAQEGLAIVQG